ncbi:MAG: chromophore lyase CpcT/CpeT [Xenococcaceae cyanobacterium]
MRKINLAGGIAIACLLTPTTPAQAIPIEQHLESVVSHLVGVMDTSAQAAANPDVPNIRMTTCKVQLAEDPNSVYLYQEQALTQRLSQPYHQHFLQIKSSADAQIVESKSFKPLNPEIWIGLCNKLESQRLIKSSDLGESVCIVFLRPLITIYIGQTQPGGCPTNVRGAVKITNTIILHSTGMDTSDRGFDADGNQVWGAVDQPYQFRWLQEQD